MPLKLNIPLKLSMPQAIQHHVFHWNFIFWKHYLPTIPIKKAENLIASFGSFPYFTSEPLNLKGLQIKLLKQLQSCYLPLASFIDCLLHQMTKFHLPFFKAYHILFFWLSLHKPFLSLIHHHFYLSKSYFSFKAITLPPLLLSFPLSPIHMWSSTSDLSKHVLCTTWYLSQWIFIIGW